MHADIFFIFLTNEILGFEKLFKRLSRSLFHVFPIDDILFICIVIGCIVLVIDCVRQIWRY